MRKHIVVLTGAGVSAESGLKTFRDGDGLWMGYDVRDVASPEGWMKDRKLVLDFYNMRRREVLAAVPNKAHITLASLEEKYDVTIVTQNIDDLHERAGSTNVIHLHGEIFKMRSIIHEGKSYEIRADINVGDLAPNGHQLRPDIVWFGEEVPMIEKAANVMNEADIFILIGTSLQVYPAAGLINYVNRNVPKYIIDKNIPFIQGQENIILIQAPATEGMSELKMKLLSE